MKGSDHEMNLSLFFCGSPEAGSGESVVLELLFWYTREIEIGLFLCLLILALVVSRLAFSLGGSSF